MPDAQMVPLGRAALEQWESDLDRAREIRKTVSTWWDANVEAYAPKPTADPSSYGENLSTNRDFTLVERKKADLFYQQPDVQAVPSPLMQGQEALMDAHTQILNQMLSVHGVDAKDLVHRLLFDVLCPAGSGFSVMGYESATVPTPTQDPMTGQMVNVPTPIFEDIFWRWLSPKQILIPANFKSTRWDDAPWLAFEFEYPIAVVKAKGWAPETFEGSKPSDELGFDYGLGGSATDSVARGTVVFYKSALYRPDRPHPQHQSLLVFIDGIEGPVEHKDSPYQTLTPQGMLSPDSLIGFPIHPLTIRPMSDSAYVPSDCTLSRPLVNELNKFRSQMVQQRDANIMRWSYNVDTLPTDALAKIVRTPIGGMIGLPGEAFVGEGAIKELPHGNFPRENFTFNDYLDNDLARTHALDANQAGADQSGDQTATEANLRQSNTNARLGLERGVVLDWYIRGVTKYSTLIQRFLSLQDASAIVGPQAAQQWDGWRKQVPARMAFMALPDAALRHDLASERKRALDEYSFFAKDPMIDRGQLLKHLLPKLHYPISVLVTQPPSPHPEPTKPTFNFTGDDLNPINPQFPIVMEILRQAGVNVSPQAVQEAQAGSQNQLLMQHAQAQDTGKGATGPDTTHPGKMAQAESLSKHQTDLTGGMPSTGQPTDMGVM